MVATSGEGNSERGSIPQGSTVRFSHNGIRNYRVQFPPLNFSLN